ncbi:hypothetical protein TTHERM_000740571 (macronuclear) [Tetrahymena thermophila SB210]|uniref:Uncharacterized protein n=1 Tax=Tetrahymena thermophila (strain SB210) TaxID=312017 RepID=W7XIW8_TETTS|nr:hypothetical protein TTHERM_000740571 [Tetrahymena thermophila SB210]EWS74996.1 hypothetical protein TTHERM_000740571 [Tetrahymena thermophila SB210]|eukprot:XP_012652454.1 hypothetical protein TTHERM_000740571 [Tetrahymena thermophila SB210]
MNIKRSLFFSSLVVIIKNKKTFENTENKNKQHSFDFYKEQLTNKFNIKDSIQSKIKRSHNTKENMKQIYLFFIIYLIRAYCKPCQSQNLYGNVCHSSYVKKFILDQDLNQAYSISDDQLIITWNIISGQYINSFSGHRSFLVDINLDENGNIYSVSSTGDIIIQNKYNSSIKQIFNCTNGRVIQNITKFDSTFNYFLYYDSSQTKVNLLVFCNRKLNIINTFLENIIMLEHVKYTRQTLFFSIFFDKKY